MSSCLRPPPEPGTHFMTGGQGRSPCLHQPAADRQHLTLAQSGEPGDTGEGWLPGTPCPRGRGGLGPPQATWLHGESGPLLCHSGPPRPFWLEFPSFSKGKGTASSANVLHLGTRGCDTQKACCNQSLRCWRQAEAPWAGARAERAPERLGLDVLDHDGVDELPPAVVGAEPAGHVPVPLQ